MKIEQIYTGCLAQGAYYIESDGEAIVIDPLREVKPYMDRLEKDGAQLKYILETHFHADFVSGHISLAEETNATIVFGPNAEPKFEAYIAKDEEVLKLGNITIKVLHTPGHTLESVCYLLRDENGKDYAIFTGDTLFLGDVGRPDLAQKAQLTTKELAGMLYDSLHQKIMPLSDDITVYPAHGAGSACGKNMMKETVDSLGNQKQTNYALNVSLTKEEFTKQVTDGLLPPPGYFPHNVRLNKEGYTNVESALGSEIKALSPEEFENVAAYNNALILDVRSTDQFSQDHIPGSIFIGLDGNFAPWVGELVIDILQPLILVVDEARIEEATTRLARIGFDNILGYLNGGITNWKKVGKETDSLASINVNELENSYSEISNHIFDVRKINEYSNSHIVTAKNTPLSNLNDYTNQFPKTENAFIHCAGGYRSVIAASILKKRGIHNIINVLGGYDELIKTNIPMTETACSTKTTCND